MGGEGRVKGSEKDGEKKTKSIVNCICVYIWLKLELD